MKTKAPREKPKSLDLNSYRGRHGSMTNNPNRKWNFTPEHWARLLAAHNAGPDEKSQHLSKGISEFRKLLNK